MTLEQINEIFDKKQWNKLEKLDPNKLTHKQRQHILFCLHYFKQHSNFVNKCKMYQKY